MEAKRPWGGHCCAPGRRLWRLRLGAGGLIWKRVGGGADRITGALDLGQGRGLPQTCAVATGEEGPHWRTGGAGVPGMARWGVLSLAVAGALGCARPASEDIERLHVHPEDWGGSQVSRSGEGQEGQV